MSDLNSKQKFLHPNLEYLAPKFTLEPIHLISDWPQNVDFSVPEKLGLHCYLWTSARAALREIRDYKSNEAKASVRITTTSQSSYLSNCLTETFKEGIERGNSLDRHTDIFAADFGYQNELLSEGATIYDDAWSFSIDLARDFLVDSDKFYVTSLPKVMGASYGALVLTQDSCFYNDSNLKENEIGMLSLLTTKLFLENDSIGLKRKNNLLSLGSNLGSEFTNYFEDFKTFFPGAGIFRYNSDFDEVRFKSLLNLHGIRGTSFFGNNAIILPVHQKLSEADIYYLSEIAKHCMMACRG